MISAAERQERLDAVQDVVGTQHAEGIHLGPAVRALMLRHAGEVRRLPGMLSQSIGHLVER